MYRKEVKGKGKKKSYIHLNAEFQRLSRRDKKAFLSDQCKEIEENNRMGKIRDLFKEIRDTKGTFHPKMGTIKDRNYMEVTNRYKGLDMIDRVPEELWTRFVTLYRRQGSKPSPRERNANRQNGCLQRPYK